MAKKIDPAILDLALAEIAKCDEMYVCTSEPADRTGAIAAAIVGPVSMTPGDGNDYTIAPGTVGNPTLGARKVTMAPKDNQLVINGGGDATHIALCLSTDTPVYLVTTTPTTSLTDGTNVDIGSWSDEIREPT